MFEGRSWAASGLLWGAALLAVACSPLPSPAPWLDAPPLAEALPVPAGALEGPAWVLFVDRGALADDGIARDAALASLDLSPEARSRRLRYRRDADLGGAGGEELPDGVLWGDLPPDPAYVEVLTGLGLRIRGQSGWLNAVSVESLGGRADEVVALPFVRRIRPVGRRAPRPSPSPMDWGDGLGSFGGLLSPGDSSASQGNSPAGPREHESPPSSPYDYGSGAWQAEAVAAPALHGLELTGEGVIVGVMDTGFRMTHSTVAPLVDQVIGQWDAISGDVVVDDQEGDATGQASHGTSVLSCLAGRDEGNLFGIAPDISLLLGKTERIDQEEPYEEDYWVYGVTWAEQQGADLVTSSLGWIDWYDPEDMDGATATSTVFAEGIATETGLLLINSAGNTGSGEGTIVAPADGLSVVAVGAMDEDNHLASFSARGPTADGRIKPDVVAPGKGVSTADWDTASDLRQGNGTSYAAPIAAGVAALLMQAHPEWGRDDVVDALRSTASSAANPDNDWGYGLINGWAACGLRCSCHDSDQDGSYDQNCGGDDCDDRDPRRLPGGTEECDGLDNDCDGTVPTDELDLDDDGQSPCDGDCNDVNAALNGLDLDGDGSSLCDGDCADGDPARYPGAEELAYDGVDQDCDGLDLVDQDGDGVAGGPTGSDCDDWNPATYPDPLDADGLVVSLGGHELCFDGRDNDCDGLVGASDPDCTGSSNRNPETILQTALTFSSAGCSTAGAVPTWPGAGPIWLSFFLAGGLWARGRRRQRQGGERRVEAAR